MDRRQAGKLGLAVTSAALAQAITRPTPAQAAESESGALALLRAAEASDLGPGIIDELLDEVQRLAVTAQTTPPQVMLASLQPALARLPGLLRLRMPLGQRRDLLTIAAALLYRSACARFDAGQHHEAVTDARVATRLAEQAGHNELAALALQCQAWIAVFTQHPNQALQAVQDGLMRTGPGSIVAVHLHGHEGRARASLGDRAGATAALQRMQAAFEHVDPARTPPGLAPVMLDEVQLDDYASYVAARAGEAAAAERAAWQVLAACDPEQGRCPWPRRISLAWVTIGLARAHAGQPDGAAEALLAALAASPPSDALLTAKQTVALLDRRYPSLPQLGTLRDALHAAASLA